MRMSRTGLVLLGLMVTLLAGCVGSATNRPADPDPNQQTASPRQGPKIISMTVKAEPNVLVTDLETVGGTIYANGAVHPHLNSYLVIDDPTGVTVPILATGLPSLDNGTIRLLDDGRMETTWKLKQGVKWHDG